MTDQQFTAGGLEMIVGNYLQELEDAPDRDAVTRKYAEAYPAIATVLQDLGAQERVFAALRPGGDGEYPKRLPDFHIVREIGRGGMGVVFEAWQESLERRVALKVLRGRLTGPEQERFRREQLVLAQLHQTNIVPIHVSGQHGPWHYFAMAYVQGASLHQIIHRTSSRDTLHREQTPTLAETARQELKSRGHPCATRTSDAERPAAELAIADPRPAAAVTLSASYFASVASFIASTAEAVHYAHSVGVIHRDLKPSNVLVDTDGQPRLIDFGLAWRRWRATRELPAATTEADPVLTHGPMGTPRYMAPEQWTEPTANPDARVDVWALGTILYELLALRPAFDAKSSADVRKQVLATDPAPLRSVVKNVPPDLAAVCRKALRKGPAERYQSAREMAEDLRRWLRREPTEAYGLRLLRRPIFWARRSPWLAAALTVTVGALVGVAILWALLAEADKAKANAGEKEARILADAAEDRARASRRDLLLRNLERHRLIAKELGWSEKAWGTARELVELDAGGNLRDQAAAVLLGPDATALKTILFRASAVAWDRKGERLLMGGNRDQVGRLWDVSKLDPVESRQRGEGPVTIAKDGRPLQLVKLDDGTLRVWDAADNETVRDLKLPGEGKPRLRAYALAEDGSHAAAVVAIPGGKATIAVWDIGSGKLLKQWERETTNIALTPDGAFLAAGSESGVVSVFSVAEGKEVATLKGTRRASVSALAFGRNVRRTQDAAPLAEWLLAVGDVGSGVTVWNPRLAVPVAYCEGSHFQIFSLAFSPDGVTLASGGRDRVILWDIPTGKPILNLLHVGDYHNALAFSPDGARLAVCSAALGGGKPAVHVLEIQNGRGLKTLRGLVGEVAKVSFSPDGTRMAAVSHNMDTAVWEWPSGRLLHVFDTPKGMWANTAGVAFSHDNKRLAYSSHKRAVLYDLTTGKELRSWELPIGFVEHMAFDKTDERLMLFRVETNDPKVAPWGPNHDKFPRVCALRDLLGKEPLTPVKKITDFEVHVFDAVMTTGAGVVVADGIRKVEGKHERRVKAFSGLTGELLWTLEHERTTNSQVLALDPSGTVLLLLFSGGDGRANYLPRLYDTKTGKLLGPLGRKGSAWCISAVGEFWGIGHDNGFAVGRKDDEQQLLTLGLDIPHASIAAGFHPRHPQVAWGTRDGTVIVADLVQVQTKLAELKLGW